METGPQGLFIYRRPEKGTLTSRTSYLADQTLQLAQLLVDSGSFGTVFVDGDILYAKSPNHRAVISISFRSDPHKNHLGKGRLIYVAGVAEMFELDTESNGGREHLLVDLYARGANQFSGNLMLFEVGGGRSQIHLEHRGLPVFDGSDKPPIDERYLASAVTHLELTYDCVKWRDEELEGSLVNKEPIYRKMEDWIQRLESGELQPFDSSKPGSNIAEGL